jgi:hypothetical protein
MRLKELRPRHVLAIVLAFDAILLGLWMLWGGSK